MYELGFIWWITALSAPFLLALQSVTYVNMGFKRLAVYSCIMCAIMFATWLTVYAGTDSYWESVKTMILPALMLTPLNGYVSFKVAQRDIGA
jgi:hypothetical protein